jgi:hypothetical protein
METRKRKRMKDFLRKIEWIWDFYFVYFLFNPMKVHRYHDYMWQKWGSRYCSLEELENYKKTIS